MKELYEQYMDCRRKTWSKYVELYKAGDHRYRIVYSMYKSVSDICKMLRRYIE